VRGRDFTAFDVSGSARVAILSEAPPPIWHPAKTSSAGGSVRAVGWLTLSVMADPVSSADVGRSPSDVCSSIRAVAAERSHHRRPNGGAGGHSRAPSRGDHRVDADLPVFAVSTLREELRAKKGVARAMT